jgi:hypothetical protein
MTGSYVGLVTAFLVDNSHAIPLVNRLPAVAYWFLPGLIGLPFLVRSLSRYTPKRENAQKASLKKEAADATNSLR